MSRLERTLGAVGAVDGVAMAAARARLDGLAKPPGSLGRLEELAVWLAGVTGDPLAPIDRRAIVVAAGDHGVARARAVSAWPSEVTAQMVATFLAGGAAISQLAAAAGARLVVVDVGVASAIPPSVPVPGVELRSCRIGPGTADMTVGPAMRREEAMRAIESGLDVVDDLVAGARSRALVVGVGEMGIGNTTAASALVAGLTGAAPEEVTGRGTGVDDAGLDRKVRAVAEALAVNAPDAADPVGVLAAVGGFEIASLVGVICAAAAHRVPLVLDGFITGAAALVAVALEPAIGASLLASHRSAEPGHRIVLHRLGLRPLLELDLRLGEGTGAALAMLLLDAAVRVRDGMATLDGAGVSGSSAGPPA